MKTTNRKTASFDKWQIAFAADCNLRCSYCSTGHGTFGRKKKIMKPEVWEKITQLFLKYGPKNGQACFEFGGGETFIDFDKFIKMIKYTHHLTSREGFSVLFLVSTNGTLLNKNKLKVLADNGIFLTFSIDGPKEINDAHRVDRNERGSFETAIKNYRIYRQFSKKHPRRPGINVQSVLTQKGNFLELIRFWEKENQPVFATKVQTPTRFGKTIDLSTCENIQKRYLNDFKNWATGQARRLNIPGFMTNYRGPVELYELWKALFLEKTPAVCGAGENIIAVDVNGNLYPCEAFLGVKKWKIGSVYDDIDHKRLTEFNTLKNQAISNCNQCTLNEYCPKNCFGRDIQIGIDENFKKGCEFSKQISEIAFESYKLLSLK